MKRIDFLRNAGVGLLSSPLVLAACSASTDTVTPSGTTTTQGSTNGSSAADCSVTPSETAGPFPTKNPTNFIMQNIAGDRTGVPLLLNITIKNLANGCAALEGAYVDVWHCDAAGEYSQYSGMGMQNNTAVNWLRGRQATVASGVAGFKTIFPGWYSGRAPHIHVHVYSATGKSLLVTQIAFPKAVCDNVYANATNFYKKGLQDTTNERDNIFSDSVAKQLGGITGSIADGYTLTHTIVVSA